MEVFIPCPEGTAKGTLPANRGGSDSSKGVLSHRLYPDLAQSLANRLDGLLGVKPGPVFHSAPPMQVLAIVRSTDGVVAIKKPLLLHWVVPPVRRPMHE